jgi:Curlin associated repeat
MRIVTGLAAVLLLALQPLPARSGEAFVTEVFVSQVATAKIAIAGIKSPTGGALMPAMLASPLPLNTLDPATQPALAGGTGNFSGLAQYGSNNFAAIVQTGAANQSVVTQNGGGNTALVTQRGSTH